jgi:hypothetical protein
VTSDPTSIATNRRQISIFALLDAWKVSSLNFQENPSNGNEEIAKAHCSSGKAPLNFYSLSFSLTKIMPFWGNLEKYCRAGQATDDIIQRMRFTCWITKAANIPSAYVITTTLPRQNWLRERASICVA